MVIAPACQAGDRGFDPRRSRKSHRKVAFFIPASREMLASPGEGRVLVVDGGASLRCALVGDMLALLAVDNGWAGVVVYGAIRDSRETGTMPLGLRALGTNPRRSLKSGQGETQVPISIGEVTVAPAEWLYADEDGIVISAIPLTAPRA